MEQAYCDDRAQRGAALLDEEHPGWLDEVSEKALNIGSCTLCVLGQLYPEYDDGVADLFGDAELWSGFPQAKAHGFDDGDNAAYAALTDAWRRIIAARRDEGAQGLADAGWVLSRDALDMISPATGAARSIANPAQVTYPPVEKRPVQARF